MNVPLVDPKELSVVLSEFYSGQLSNTRRIEIETWINNKFGTPLDSTRWQKALYLLLNISPEQTTQYIQWFALYILEEMIKNKTIYNSIDTKDKDVIKQTLFEILGAKRGKMHASVWTKVCNLIVNIGKIEWPQQFPKLVDHTLELCMKQDTTLVGLTLLGMISEEFISDREDLSASRKRDLKNNLALKAPHIIDFINQYLKFLQTGVDQGSEQARTAATKLLETATTYFSWLSLEKAMNIDWSVAQTIFKFATRTLERDQNMSIAAISCLNEIMSKSFVPKDAEPILFGLFEMMLQILHVTVGNQFTAETLSKAFSEEYLDKVTLLVNSFVQFHIKRAEAIPNFPMIQFFSMFFKHTFLQPHTEQFESCLDVWILFMDHLKESDGQLLAKYKDALIGLSNEVLLRSLFTHGSSYLTFLDDERTDTNGLSEVDLYLSNCMDCIELVSTFYPETMVPMLYAKLQQLTKVYDEVKTPTIKPTSPIGPTSPSLMQNFDSKKIPLDVQFYLRLFARMSSIFVERFDSTAQQATLFMNEVFKIISIGNPIMIGAALSTCVNMVPWMVKCSALESIRRDFENLLSAIMSIIVHKALSANFSHGVVLNQVIVNASILLVSVTLTIKPQFIVKTDSFQYLYQNLPNWTTVEFSQLKCDGYSGMTVLQNLYTSIANVILTRGVDADLKEKNQLEEWQQGMFRNFAQNLLMTRFRSTLVSLQTSPQAKLELAMLLYILSSIVNRADDLQKSARLIVMQNFQLAIENVIPLVRAFINDTIVLEPLLHFMLSLIRSLKVQIGLEFIEKCVMLFLELFSVDTMQQLVKNNAHGVMVQFLQLLISIVQDGSGRFTPLTDRIVDICRNIIFPHLRPDDKFGVEVLPVYYQLLYSIVNFNLKYFFDINVNVSRDPLHAKPQSEQAVRDFSFIFECYLKSFQSLDITIFRENINYLKELDNNRKIFGREIFVKSMLGAFLNCFLVVLVNKSHTLLREDIISVMYVMNRSSNWVVFEQFLSNFLMQQANLSNDQKGQLIRDSFQTIDFKANLQAFERCIQQFVNDLNFLTKH